MDNKPNTQNVLKTPSCLAVVNSFETSNVKLIIWLLLRVVYFCLDPIIKIKLNFIFRPRPIKVRYAGSVLNGSEGIVASRRGIVDHVPAAAAIQSASLSATGERWKR